MELKRTAVFLGVIGLMMLGARLLLWPLLSWSVAERPATARSICAESERLSESDITKDRIAPMSRTACRGAADARNDRPERETSLEYREGYLYGLRLKCFRAGQSVSEMDECVDTWKMMEKAYREKHDMD